MSGSLTSSGGAEFTVASAAQTQALAERLGAVLEAGDLLVLNGSLGAGKTTFTQGLGRGLGVRPGIISPTFVLVRIHPNRPDGPRPGGPDLVHVDAYRLGSAAEIDDIDLENTLDSAVTVVEWGEGRVEHLAESRLEVHLVRAHGTSALPPPSTGLTVDEAQSGGDGPNPDGDGGDDSGEDVDAGDGVDEPRTIRIRPVGLRWAGVDLLQLLDPQADRTRRPPAPKTAAGTAGAGLE